MTLTKSNNKNFTLKSGSYTLVYDEAKPLYVDLTFSNNIGAELFIASGCERDNGIDQLISLDAPAIEEKAGETKITFVGKTTLWDKVEYVFECKEDKVLYGYKVFGNGKIETARFFEGFEQDNPNVGDKFRPLFCGPSREVSHKRPVKFFSSGSKPKFDLLYTSSINSTDTRYLMYYEDSRLGIGDRFYYGGDWLVTPPPYLYLLGTRAKDAWVTMALVIEKKKNTFDFFEYKGGEEFGFTLDYSGYTKVEGSWESPKILMEAAKTEYGALESYVAYLRDNDYVTKNDRSNVPRWWKEPIFGGWGEQMFHSSHWDHYWESKSFGWSGSSAELCTRASYTKMMKQLEDKKLNPTILIVDNRWFRPDNQLEVDEELWPDMKGWIKEQHEMGRKVILWVSAFNYHHESNGDDVPFSECLIRHEKDYHKLDIDTDVFYKTWHRDAKIERVKKKAEYTQPEDGWRNLMPVFPNPQNEEYIKRVSEKVHYLLSPEGLDADGFEFDYTHFGPHFRGMERGDGKENIEFGAEMIHNIIEIYYKAAKKAKKDALIITHTFNPYFDDVIDMLRLQDIYTDNASIVDQMDHRSQTAQRVCPGCVVHTDQHPMPSLEAWREYAKYQSKIGNPCLYYVTGIETTYEEYTEEDFQLLRDTWEAHHKKLDEEYGEGSRCAKKLD